MSHVHTISQRKAILSARFYILRFVRHFFESKQFLEVETPTILRFPGQEPYLSPMSLCFHNDSGVAFTGYLHTSPEYTMKKLLAAGFPNIVSIGKCFRDGESFGGTHNPEFTMIEWYRRDADFYAIMDDVEALCAFVQKKLRAAALLGISNTSIDFGLWNRCSMKELWQETIGIQLDDYLTRESMVQLAQRRGYPVRDDEQYDTAFYYIFFHEIEHHLVGRGNCILHHYPAPMAALSRLSSYYPGYAERFEVYVQGVELGNAFSELTNAREQKNRLTEERELRKQLGKEVFDIDDEFVHAVDALPACSGIAFGFDRLVQILLGCQNIDDVIVLPMSTLFDTDKT